MEASLPDPSNRLTSPYADPREIDHPLTPLADIGASVLVWVQPRLMHPAYELWSGEHVVATLRYRDLSGREAVAASAHGLWLFREGARPSESISVSAAHKPFAVFRKSASAEGLLLLGEAHTFPWVRRSLVDNRFAFVNDRGDTVVEFRDEPDEASSSRVVIAENAVDDTSATLLAVVGKYLLLSS